MARILAISSQVARGHVGLSVVVPALQAMGHEVIGLPTVLLSNHPGHPHVAGTQIDPGVLRKMVGALDDNGWLGNIDGLLTGYLPSTAHVEFALWTHSHLNASRGSPVTFLCDPVMGDDPAGLYIDPAVAAAIAGSLVPKAAILTPNRFELTYLSGTDVQSGHDCMNARLAGNAAILATSIPSGSEATTLNILRAPGATGSTRVPLRPAVPHGTGDLFSALVLSAVLDGGTMIDALAFATAGVDATLAGSAGRDELAVAALPTRSKSMALWPTEPVMA